MTLTRPATAEGVDGTEVSSCQFDRVAPSYATEVDQAVRFVGQDASFFLAVKADLLIEWATRYLDVPAGLTVLDVGCGVGSMDRFLCERIPALHGVDVSPESIRLASERFPSVKYQCYAGDCLPFQDGQFDLVFAACVVHHMPPSRWSTFVGELNRLVRPGGLVVVFEHNPWNPLTRWAVARCAFDTDAVLIRRRRLLSLMRGTGLSILPSPYILFFPWRGGWLRAIEKSIGWLPCGAQYAAIGQRVR